ncbi:MAG: helix-turn-helix domain-containing protein [Cyanobacteria bacterium P01_G01_bin.38]
MERSHYQIIWLLAQGRSTAEVSEVTGYSRGWVYKLVWGYNDQGPESPTLTIPMYGFVCPQTGQTYWWLMPRMNTKTFSRVLEDFARHFEVNPQKHLIIRT